MESRIINEVAFRVSDEEFKDFPKHHYKRIYDRIVRQLSRKYKINLRRYIFKNRISDENEVPIELYDFVSPSSLKVNGEEYNLKTKIDFNSNEKHYILYRDYNKLVFNYSPKSKEDVLELIYTADIKIDNDIEDIETIIPPQYEEEIINLCVMEICKIALAKFSGEEGNKYMLVYKLYQQNNKELNQDTVKKEGWTVIKPRWVV